MMTLSKKPYTNTGAFYGISSETIPWKFLWNFHKTSQKNGDSPIRGISTGNHVLLWSAEWSLSLSSWVNGRATSAN